MDVEMLFGIGIILLVGILSVLQAKRNNEKGNGKEQDQ